MTSIKATSSHISAPSTTGKAGSLLAALPPADLVPEVLARADQPVGGQLPRLGPRSQPRMAPSPPPEGRPRAGPLEGPQSHGPGQSSDQSREPDLCLGTGMGHSATALRAKRALTTPHRTRARGPPHCPGHRSLEDSPCLAPPAAGWGAAKEGPRGAREGLAVPSDGHAARPGRGAGRRAGDEASRDALSGHELCRPCLPCVGRPTPPVKAGRLHGLSSLSWCLSDPGVPAQGAPEGRHTPVA